jgi:carboxylesterase
MAAVVVGPRSADKPQSVCQTRLVRPLPPSSAAAFTLPVDDDRRRGAALCLHGYTGTPYEVRVIADDVCARLGLAVHAPLLPGHGDDPAALNHLDDDAWSNAALDAFDHLDDLDPVAAGQTRPRVIVGCSMGGLLALQVCARRHVDAVVLLAPALRLFPLSALGVSALSAGLWRVRPFIQKESPGGDVGDVDAARKNPTYKVLPTRGLATLSTLQQRTAAMLSSVQTPLCTLHGDLDRTIDPVSSRLIAQQVKSPVVEHHRLRHTRHLVGLDVERDLVSDLGCDFIRRTLASAAASAPSSTTTTTNARTSS